MLPELSNTLWLEPWAGESLAVWVTDPEVEAAFQRLRQAGQEIRKCLARRGEFDQLMSEYGFPQLYQGAMIPPFDMVSNSLRGMKGTMLDMFRQPDKLLETCDFLLDKLVERPLPPPNENGHTRIFMTNTRGSDNFMSTQQFETFYWPTFKKLVDSLIERGATPCIFFEGNFDSRLEYLLDFPRRKILVRLDKTDIFRAKEILGGHFCIEGNVPSTLLQMGSEEEVRAHCKELIDVVGKDGGFILAPRSSTDEVKPQNLKVMIEFTKEYGRY
jgi:uroporphyrinogen-III decarboxylase